MAVNIEDVKTFIVSIIAEELRESATNIDTSAGFHTLGLDSINSVFLLEKVETEYDLTLTPLYFWDYPTIDLFATQIFKELSP